MADTNQQRLNRIEEKIDKLSDAMVSLARTEEKIHQMEKNHQAAYERMNRFSQKLDAIEAKVNDNAHTVGIINRVTLVGVTALIGGMIKMFWF